MFIIPVGKSIHIIVLILLFSCRFSKKTFPWVHTFLHTFSFLWYFHFIFSVALFIRFSFYLYSPVERALWNEAMLHVSTHTKSLSHSPLSGSMLCPIYMSINIMELAENITERSVQQAQKKVKRIFHIYTFVALFSAFLFMFSCSYVCWNLTGYLRWELENEMVQNLRLDLRATKRGI